MTYAEAVKRSEMWNRRYSEKLAAMGGEPLAEDVEALAVLRRAESVMEAAEAADVEVSGVMPFCRRGGEVLLRRIHAYKEKP